MKKMFLLFIVTFIYSPSVFAETLKLGRTGSVEIDIPQGWTKDIMGGSTPRGIEYRIDIAAPEGAKAKCIITLIAASDGYTMSKSDYKHQVDGYTAQMAAQAVEKKPSLKPWTPKNGMGQYCILTDEWLSGKSPRDGQYKYAGLYFARYQNGCVLIATALADDANSSEFQQMRRLFESIGPKLHVPRTGKIKMAKTERGALFYTDTNKTTMLVPARNLSPYNETASKAGGARVSSYFYYIDEKQSIRMSGWFFPEEEFCFEDMNGHWKKNLPSNAMPALMAAGNREHKKLEEWDIVLYDQPSVGGSVMVHLRASTIRKGTWIDLHLSTSRQKQSDADAPKILLDYLAAIELADKK